MPVLAGHPLAAAEMDGGRVCYTPRETRAAIDEFKLADPFAALREASRSMRAEPLISRLCKWGDMWVYEMTLLPQDGKVTRVYVNAEDGLPVNVRN